ncbi:hypothetical protein [Sphingomonas sp. Root241]|uniref:hypothetical protein n=1 Tax=Sphingomonas sp. Root241 TaxID=1736501 RepID=UPI0012E3F6E2|nr:hypothetical protein [Sphingomonas sp. Root241]
MIVLRILLTLPLIGCAEQPFVEQRAETFEGVGMGFVCSNVSTPRKNKQFVIAAARLDGHSIVRYGSIPGGGLPRFAGKFVDAISYYAIQDGPDGKKLRIRAGGQALAGHEEVELTIHQLKAGEWKADVSVKGSGVDYRASCLPVNSGAES